MSNSHKSDNGTNKWQKFAEQTANQEQESLGTEPAGSEQQPQRQPEQQSEHHEQQLGFPTRQQLEDQLTAMERQMEEYKQQALRVQAEAENVRRRAERDVSNAHKYGVEQLVNALLPVADSLVRGLESSDTSDPRIKAMHDGIQLTLDLLQKTLMKFGVEVIDPPIGSPFDPEFHEAMGVQSQPEAKPNTVAQVLQRGYQLHGRVLRAAMVMVVGA